MRLGASADSVDSFMQPIISVNNLSKTYASGFQALRNINLEIRRGEIFALLGPNGAGKTTLISIICGIVTVTDYRASRAEVGLVPQEMAADIFATPWDSVRLSRALFGKPANPDYLAKV